MRWLRPLLAGILATAMLASSATSVSANDTPNTDEVIPPGPGMAELRQALLCPAEYAASAPEFVVDADEDVSARIRAASPMARTQMSTSTAQRPTFAAGPRWLPVMWPYCRRRNPTRSQRKRGVSQTLPTGKPLRTLINKERAMKKFMFLHFPTLQNLKNIRQALHGRQKFGL